MMNPLAKATNPQLDLEVSRRLGREPFIHEVSPMEEYPQCWAEVVPGPPDGLVHRPLSPCSTDLNAAVKACEAARMDYAFTRRGDKRIAWVTDAKGFEVPAQGNKIARALTEALLKALGVEEVHQP